MANALKRQSSEEQEQLDRQTPAQEQQTAQREGEKPDKAPTTQDTQEKEQGKQEEKPEKGEAQALREQLDAANDKLLRTMAEYDNFRKRSQREKDEIYPQATAKTVEQFLPILDNFERALAAQCADESFKVGVEMIFQSFREVLGKLGVVEFGETGEQFDPQMHNAVMHVEDEEHEANTIVAVFQKGYKLGDRVVRHAMVQVAN